MTCPPVLSHFQAADLLQARSAGQAEALTTLDLGRSRVQLRLDGEGVTLPGGEKALWPLLEEIGGEINACYALQEDEWKKIQFFSEVTNRACSLMPTQGAPTLLVAGFPMHRIKGTDPYRDTLSKIKAIRPVRGRVLDTTTGLGYTAIEAAREADEVITIELDPAVLEVDRLNPWSQDLFENPRIHSITGDSFEVVEDFADGSFSRILHDPPTIQLAGDLYSREMYTQLFRVLARGGRLFHYIGDLKSGLGRNVVKGVLQRLQQAGFSRVQPEPNAFGVVAYK